jgi:hypothetical protein
MIDAFHIVLRMYPSRKAMMSPCIGKGVESYTNTTQTRQFKLLITSSLQNPQSKG